MQKHRMSAYPYTLHTAHNLIKQDLKLLRIFSMQCSCPAVVPAHLGMLTQQGHDFHSCKAGVPCRATLGGERGDAHNAVRSLLPGQVAVRIPALYLHLH